MGSIFVRLCGAKEVVGNRTGKFFWEKITYNAPVNRQIHRVDQNMKHLELLCGKNFDQLIEFYKHATAESDGHVEKIINDLNWNSRKLLGVHAGCDPANLRKRWALNKFYQLLCDFLNDNPDTCLLCFTGPGEDNITGAYPQDKFPDRVTIIRQSLPIVSSLLGKCDLVLTTDSGLGHIARAMETPAISIMGPADPIEVAPYGTNGHVITLTPALDCMPCVRNHACCIKDKNYCIVNLTVDTVKEQLYILWDKYTNSD